MEKLYKYVYGTGTMECVIKECVVERETHDSIWYLDPVNYKNTSIRKAKIPSNIIDESVLHAGSQKMVFLTIRDDKKAKRIFSDYYKRVISDYTERIADAKEQLNILKKLKFEEFEQKGIAENE